MSFQSKNQIISFLYHKNILCIPENKCMDVCLIRTFLCFQKPLFIPNQICFSDCIPFHISASPYNITEPVNQVKMYFRICKIKRLHCVNYNLQMSVLHYFILFTDLFYHSLFEGLCVKAVEEVRQTLYSMIFFSSAMIIRRESQNKCNDS